MIDLKAELAAVKSKRGRQHASYLDVVQRAQKARGDGGIPPSHGQSSSYDFMRTLWELPETTIAVGAGRRAVVKDQAFSDKDLAVQIMALRDSSPNPDNADLDDALTAILEYMLRRNLVTIRPKARLIRIFAVLRPWDVTCIVYEPRLDRSFARLGLMPPKAGVMQKHRLLLDALWDRLGKPDTLDEQIWYSLLAHHISDLPLPEGTVVDAPAEPVDGPTEATSTVEIHDPAHWLATWPAGDLVDLPLDAVQAAFDAADGDRHVWPDDMLPMLHAALTALPHRRFAVIGGLSGTGKSTFARLYAAAVCAVAGVEAPESHRRFVAVRPDWTDPSGLLGHPNLLFKPPRWHRSGALTLLLSAARRPTLPHVLVLEEMNLARVEHYMAPLLTAMENPDAGLRLHDLGRPIQGVPPVVRWPRNLFVIGTVNMDATTQALSDKVLDRAFVWEMSAIDIGAWRARQTDAELLDPVADLLAALYTPLEAAGRHFGYRICDEVLAICRAAGRADAGTLDSVTFSKILPRLRGDDHGHLGAALEAVVEICDAKGLERAGARARRMVDALNGPIGVARFWS